ncbi:hypothetical protein HHL19_35775 [Streptomyces sp. R302]|uniref:hypothetical protein n=1 Tax=unclassified Streptomyces TaxID=2593676 RepID=UPI00145D7169|nr:MULTISPECIES: hypothetical protein [unclassified Streptomyces]NML55100.1 hypothetical protein [Streptomyces sp. R301]NML83870.1 hypothetical protein [Streptomyces sp. R302]
MTHTPASPADVLALFATATHERAVDIAASTVTVRGADGTSFALTPGHINEVARVAFTSGQCHALARAVSDATGWPMALLADDECIYDSDLCGDDDIAEGLCACQLDHVVVVHPNGQHIDINGMFNPGAVPDYDGARTVPMTAHLWQHLLDSPHWRPPALDVARTFVAPLLASLS